MRIVSGLDQIRAHPELYLGGRLPTGPMLAGGLAECALLSQARRLTILALDTGWIAVCADADWVTPNVTPAFTGQPIEALVSSLMPLQGGGPNDVRFEAIMTAFSSNLEVWDWMK